MSPLPWCYHIYSTHYHGTPVRAVPVLVITVVTSQNFSPLAWFSQDFCGITVVLSPLLLSNPEHFTICV